MGVPEKSPDAKDSVTTELPPPSYAEASGPSTSTNPTPRQFPPAFNLYRVSGWTSDIYSLGEHQNQPLYHCTWQSSFSRSPPPVLHSGPSESFSPLATVEWHTFRGFYVDLPPLDPTSSGDGGREEVEAARRSYRFDIEVGAGNVREQFEWRHSYGDAVRSLNEQGLGWKQVRLAQGPPGAGAGAGGGNGTTSTMFLAGTWLVMGAR